MRWRPNKHSTSRLLTAIDSTFGDLSRNERKRLADSVRVPSRVADVAALVLGLDLWRGEIASWRDMFSRIDRPPMWRFAFDSTAAWSTQTWRQLPLDARVFRARVGPLATSVSDTAAGRARAALPPATLDAALQALQAGGLTREYRGARSLSEIAPAGALATDLHLVELIAHWIVMLGAADRVADDPTTDEYDMWGYAESCVKCRAHWGIRRAARWSLPPFHPGCRCFAQPRYSTNAGRRVG
jgi:hypothetical protein